MYMSITVLRPIVDNQIQKSKNCVYNKTTLAHLQFDLVLEFVQEQLSADGK